MDVRQPAKRGSGPPPEVMKKLRSRLSGREVQGMEALFALRATAQQMDNAISEWMAGTVGSVARYQIMHGAMDDQGEWDLAYGHRDGDGCYAPNRLWPDDSSGARRLRGIPRGPGRSAKTDRATDRKGER